MSYGADGPALFRLGAKLVHRVLQGRRPNDLPIEQPTKFELAVNLKDDGGGEIARLFASLNQRDCVCNIDPPTSSYAIMRRARPYCGENSGPGKERCGELTSNPELENSIGQIRSSDDVRRATALTSYFLCVFCLTVLSARLMICAVITFV